MFQNRFSVRPDAAHLTFGLSAAPAMKGRGHLLVERAQIPAPADQAVAEGAVGIFGEDRRRAAAAFRGQVRQLPDSHGVQLAAQEQTVAPSGAAPGPGCEDLRLQLADPVLLALQQLVHFGGSLARLQELCGEGGADQLVLTGNPGTVCRRASRCGCRCGTGRRRRA